MAFTSDCDTYFITANAYLRKQLLQSERMASLFIEQLYAYRERGLWLIHEFVVMPDHVHVLLTLDSDLTIERAAQFLKGGASFEARKRFGLRSKLWQPKYHDRRIRDAAEYAAFREYIHRNPVRRGLVTDSADFPFCSASGKFVLDPVPQRLKPAFKVTSQRGA
jgi:putative transposase